MSDYDSGNGSFVEEDEDYEEQQVKNQKRKGKVLKQQQKTKKSKYQFIDIAAEESDNEDDDDEVNQEIRQKNRQQEKELYGTRKTKQFMDVVRGIEEDEDIEHRYQDIASDEEDEDGEYYNENMPDNLRKHKIKVRDDQKVFSVPVRKTREKEVVICLLNKFAQLNTTNNYSNIYSISYLPNTESLIYIEARSKRDVLAFLDKYQDCNINKVELVNMDDHVSSYQDREQEKYNVEEGMFVQVSQKCRNSDYIEDMGKVYSIKPYNKVVVKLIPRVNIEAMNSKAVQGKKKSKDSEYVEIEGDQEETQKKNSFFSRKYGKPIAPTKSVQEIKAKRPDQQFFSSAEYENVFRDNNAYRHVTNMFEPEGEHCGYVYQTFHCKDLVLNYQPRTLDELTKFFPHLDTDQIFNENAKFLKKSIAMTNFFVGDSVLINGGQMKGLKGKIISLTNDTAKISIKSKKRVSIEEEVEVKDLTKYFEDGQRVKVISGSNQGATGNVLSTNDDICVVFTDNKNTIEVRSKDLAVTGELDNDIDKTVSSAIDPNDRTALKKKDLVKLTGFNSVGLVLDISKDYVKILDISGKIKNESNFSINTKIDTRKFVSRNAEGSNITNNSNVIIKQGQYQGYQCQVIHVFKTYVFLFNPKFRDTYAVETVNNVSLQTTNPVIVRQEARIAYDMKYGKQELRPDDMRQYIGKQMRIIKGKYKGFQCTVVEIRNDQIKVEINSKHLIVFISKTDLIASDKPAQELEAGKTPSYVTQSTYQPSLSTRDHNLGSPDY